jgi:hypothetical protein
MGRTKNRRTTCHATLDGVSRPSNSAEGPPAASIPTPARTPQLTSPMGYQFRKYHPWAPANRRRDRPRAPRNTRPQPYAAMPANRRTPKNVTTPSRGRRSHGALTQKRSARTTSPAPATTKTVPTMTSPVRAARVVQTRPGAWPWCLGSRWEYAERERSAKGRGQHRLRGCRRRVRGFKIRASG